MRNVAPAPIFTWLPEPVPDDVTRALARLARTEDIVHVAVMPDVHLAADVCIGTVVATERYLYPEAVGGDIGCGMSAICFAGEAERIAERTMAGALLAYMQARVPSRQHPSTSARLPAALYDRPLSAPRLEQAKARIGRVQFATLGRGNHFIELQRGNEGELWLMVHSGSRGIGQAIRDHHLVQATPASTGLRFLDADADAGRAYLADLAWALDYAAESRRRMMEIVACGIERIAGTHALPETAFDCHHNFVRHEEHNGRALWVHRKGAISARHGEPGIIPGSMGSASFHVAGRGHPASLCSSSHGAGRVMSRTDARRAISLRALQRQMQGVWFDQRMADRLRDEAPGAYKDIGAVMRAQRELTRIVRRVEPVISYKAA